MTLPPAEGTEKATQAAIAAVQHLVTKKGKDVTAGGKGKRKYMQAQCTKIAKYAADKDN